MMITTQQITKAWVLIGVLIVAFLVFTAKLFANVVMVPTDNAIYSAFIGSSHFEHSYQDLSGLKEVQDRINQSVSSDLKSLLEGNQIGVSLGDDRSSLNRFPPSSRK